jgi:hypothetical protein
MPRPARELWQRVRQHFRREPIAPTAAPAPVPAVPVPAPPAVPAPAPAPPTEAAAVAAAQILVADPRDASQVTFLSLGIPVSASAAVSQHPTHLSPWCGKCISVPLFATTFLQADTLCSVPVPFLP